MLYYLVTYVRENLDKGPPTAVLGDAPNLAIIPDSAVPSKSQRTDGPAMGDQRLAEPHRLSAQPIRGGSTALTLLIVAGMVVELCGCACLRRDKVDSKVVSARQMSLQGIEALQCGKWDDAEQCFAGALRQNPADERAHRHFAEVLWHRGDLRNAIQHQEESVRLSGGDTTLLVQLGEMYLQDNNIEAASECVEEALDGNRHVSGAWALRGDIHRRRGESNQAFECYHRALNYQPHYPHVQLALSELYQQGGKSRRALATLEALASNYAPDEVPPEVDYQRGLALKHLGRYQDATDALARATGRGDPSADWWFQLSEAEFLAGNMAPARLALQSALTKTPTHSASLNLQDRMDRQSQGLTASLDRK